MRGGGEKGEEERGGGEEGLGREEGKKEAMTSTKLVDNSLGMDLRNTQALRPFLLPSSFPTMPSSLRRKQGGLEDRRLGETTSTPSSPWSLMVAAASASSRTRPFISTSDLSSAAQPRQKG